MIAETIAMEKSGWALCVAAACLALAGCSLLRPRALPPPVSAVFPLQEESRIVYEGEVNRLVQNLGGRLVFTTRKGWIYGVDAAKKEIAWSFSAQAAFSKPPCLGESRIICADQENCVYCLDEAGQLIWKKQIAESISSHLGQGFGKILLATEDALVLALDEATGQEAWRLKVESAATSGPVFWNRQAIFGTADGRLFFLAADGRLLASFKTGAGIRGQLFIDADRLFFGLDDDTFNSLNLATRKRRWKIRTGGFLTSAPLADERRIFFLNSNGVLFCLGKRSGEILWWRPIPSPTSFRPEICGDEILAASLSRLLLGFYRKNGDRSGTLDAGQELKSNPLVLDSGLVISLYDREAGQGILVFLKRKGAARPPSPKK